MSIDVLFVVLALVVLLWFGVAHYLRGADLTAWDRLPDAFRQRFSSGAAPNDEHREVAKRLADLLAPAMRAPARQRLALLRTHFDNLFDDCQGAARFVDVDAGGVAAEWVLAPGADGRRRTLYLHGGAYRMGSPRSHRPISTRFSAITGGAVLVVDYRLMPEHSRLAGIDDCRRAYLWLLENGPDGRAAASTVFVAGDSAGGNLALSLLATVRDRGWRPPAAAVVLSPATDATLGSLSLKTNIDTDPLIGPMSAPLARVPRSVLLWLAWLQNRLRPCDPVLSPVFGDLSRLPPLLIQASDAEMLLDDSLRYANKARAAGSPVRLQTWAHVAHVWHLFDPGLCEARQAFDEIRKFIDASAPRACASGEQEAV